MATKRYVIRPPRNYRRLIERRYGSWAAYVERVRFGRELARRALPPRTWWERVKRLLR